MNKYAIIAVVVATMLVLTGWQGYRLGVQHEIAKSAAALIAANNANAEKQKSLIRGVERVAQDAEIERAKIERQLADADADVERLLETIRSANARGDTSATCVADARAARTIVGQCASRYKSLAAKADKLRTTVLGLQAYARTITQKN